MSKNHSFYMIIPLMQPENEAKQYKILRANNDDAIIMTSMIKKKKNKWGGGHWGPWVFVGGTNILS